MENFKTCLLVIEMFASLSLVVANQMLLGVGFFCCYYSVFGFFFPQKNRNLILRCDNFYFRSKQEIKTVYSH